MPNGAVRHRVRVQGFANRTLEVNFPIQPTTLNRFRGVDVWIYVHNETLGSGITVRTEVQMRRHAGSLVVFRNNQCLLKPGWNPIRLAWSEFVPFEGQTDLRSTLFDTIRIRVAEPNTQPLDISVGGIWWSGSNVPRHAIVFDDGWRSVYERAFPLLESLGIPATVAIISSRSGPLYMTWSMIRELKAAGWGMMNHSHSHGPQPFLVDAPYDRCRQEIEQCADIMAANGVEAVHYASPFGENSPTYLQAAADAGMRSFRTVMGRHNWLGSPSSGIGYDAVEMPMVPCYPPAGFTTAQEALEHARRCRDSQRHTITLLHSVSENEGGPSTQWNFETQFLPFVMGLTELEGVEFVTYPELIDMGQNTVRGFKF
ncbi:MAG: polysaccharide deacetylase family protein [Fimbriimonadaceae bacterium]